MPPMTMTTKARMRMFSPMPTCTASSGPMRTPATAHRPAPMPEDQGEEALDVDAHRRRHLAVRGAGAHQRAHPRFRDAHIEQRRERQAGADDEQPVRRI